MMRQNVLTELTLATHIFHELGESMPIFVEGVGGHIVQVLHDVGVVNEVDKALKGGQDTLVIELVFSILEVVRISGVLVIVGEEFLCILVTHILPAVKTRVLGSNNRTMATCGWKLTHRLRAPSQGASC